MPLYFAFHRDQYLTSNADLNAVVLFVLECIDTNAAEDAVIWYEGRLVAVIHHDGRITSFLRSTIAASTTQAMAGPVDAHRRTGRETNTIAPRGTDSCA